MQSKLSALLVFTGLTIFITGCAENPADKVTKAEVTAPAEPAAPDPAAVPATAAPEPAAPASTPYTIADGSTIGFVGSKVTGSHNGGFKTFSGSFNVADGELIGSQRFVIDMNSLWADQEKLTGHLKSADFFEVETYPEAIFTLTSATPQEDEGPSHLVAGTLELHGVTKDISFPADLEISDEALTLTAEFALNRFDFGIVYKGKADDLIRQEVVVKLDITAKP